MSKSNTKTESKAAQHVNELKTLAERADEVLNELQQTEPFSMYPKRDRMRYLSNAISKFKAEAHKAEQDLQD